MGVDRRIRHIDGLRGIAVLSVVVFHLWLSYPWLRQSPIFNIAFNAGRHGVELFFVLSGFCLSYPTLLYLRQRGSTSFDLTKYWARRLVRIIPPYYVALVLSALIHALWIDRGSASFTATDILRQALFLDRGTRWANGTFWSLSLEMRWYIVFPLALAVWARYPRVFAIVLLSLPLLWTTRTVNEDVLFMPGFLFGIVAADIVIRGSRFTRYAPFAATLLIVTAAVIDPGPYGNGAAGSQGFNPLWMPAMFCAVISVGETSILRNFFSMRWLTAIGIASYSIYLVHEPLIVLARQIGMGPVLASIISCGAGFVFWAIVERIFVDTPLRDRAVASAQKRLAYFAQRLGFTETTFALKRTAEPGEELEAVA